jgi:hypothetical protein
LGWGHDSLHIALRARGIHRLAPRPQFRAQLKQPVDQPLLFLPARIQRIELHLRFGQQRGDLRGALGHVDANGLLAADDFLLDREPFDAAHAVFHLGRRRVLRHGHTRTGRV